MDVIRRNTDYAIRAMVHLASHSQNGVMPVSHIAEVEEIPYQLACKLLQKLNKAKLVQSSMGPMGGFKLRKKPSNISLFDIIETIQGPLKLNRCLLGDKMCPRQDKCGIRKNLYELQVHINSFLRKTSLKDLLKARKSAQKKVKEAQGNNQ